MNLLYNSGYNVLREYYPDILRKLFHRHKDVAAGATSPTTSSSGH
jgi:hypothetical protein